MAPIYRIVRIATLILTEATLLVSIISMVHLFQSAKIDIFAIVLLALIQLATFLGAYGSFKNNRNYLNAFALILIVFTIVGVVSKAHGYESLAYSTLVVFLVLSQAELIRRGYT